MCRIGTQNLRVSGISPLPFNLRINILAGIKDHLTFISEPFLNILKCGNVHPKVSHPEF